MRSSAFAILSLACAGLLSACNNGVSWNEEEAEVIPPGDPASVTLLVSSPQIPSASTSTGSGVQLLATVRDGNQTNVAGIPVTFSTPDPGMKITVVNGTTDTNGLAEAELTVFSDKSNRVVPVTASVVTSNGTVTSTVNVTVTGTTLAVSGPTSGQVNTPANYTATLTDSSGTGIPNASVTFASAGGAFTPAAPQVTNISGQVTASFTPSTAGGSATTVNASALGLTANQAVTLSQDVFTFTLPTAGDEVDVGTNQTVSVTWTRSNAGVSGATVTFASTRGSLSSSTAVTNASGVATVTINSAQAGLASISASGNDGTTSVSAVRNIEFVATTPVAIVLQPDPTSLVVGNTSTLRSIVRDAASNFVKNQVVNFTIDQGPGSLSSSTAITDSQGQAVVTYSATATSGAGGVIVTAEVGNTGITDTESITVGGNALRLVLGTGNTMTELSQTLYSVPYSVIVTDSNGNAVSGKTVNLSLHAMDYRKGTSMFLTPGGPWVRHDGSGNDPIICQNEDLRSPDPNLWLDGILNDPLNEDLDQDGHLDPENVGSVPGSVTTNSNGVADFNLIYPQDRAYWVRVRLRATVAVGGSEAVEDTEFLLEGTAADFANEGVKSPGHNSPYGVIQSCALDG